MIIPDIIKETARRLRKDMTESEKVLWNELKARKLLGKKFGRQVPIYVYTENSGLDRYIIPDFVCHNNKLIIELDGSIHDIKEIYLLDKEKEKLLIKLGFNIFRFKNKEVLESVLNKIKTKLQKE